MSTKLQRQAFDRRVLAFIEARGATKRLENEAYSHSIETELGTLRVSANGNWVACRFDDQARAAVFLAINPYSGKWNFHGPDTRDGLEETAEQFERALSSLLMAARPAPGGTP